MHVPIKHLKTFVNKRIVSSSQALLKIFFKEHINQDRIKVNNVPQDPGLGGYLQYSLLTPRHDPVSNRSLYLTFASR